MSSLKKFLDKRAEGVAKNQTKKEVVIDDKPKKTLEYETVITPNLGFVMMEREIDAVPDSIDLTDDEFWDISNEFNKMIKISEDSPVLILQSILKKYTPLKIEQFGKRYAELNT